MGRREGWRPHPLRLRRAVSSRRSLNKDPGAPRATLGEHTSAGDKPSVPGDSRLHRRGDRAVAVGAGEGPIIVDDDHPFTVGRGGGVAPHGPIVAPPLAGTQGRSAPSRLH